MIKIKYHTNWFILRYAAITFSGIFTSCKKEPDDLGLGILPGEDNLEARSDTLYNILADTVKLKPVFTFAPGTNFNYGGSSLLRPNKGLGIFQDTFRGGTKSSLLLSKQSELTVKNPDLIITADVYKAGQSNTFGKVALDFSPGKAKLNIIYSKQ
jgi:hypothetical protein